MRFHSGKKIEYCEINGFRDIAGLLSYLFTGYNIPLHSNEIPNLIGIRAMNAWHAIARPCGCDSTAESKFLTKSCQKYF